MSAGNNLKKGVLETLRVDDRTIMAVASGDMTFGEIEDHISRAHNFDRSKVSMNLNASLIIGESDLYVFSCSVYEGER